MTECRLPCCVPFCRRTRKLKPGETFTEWLCGDHWRLIERSARRAYGRRARRWRRFRVPGDYGPALRLWEWLKRRAIERAAAIR